MSELATWHVKPRWTVAHLILPDVSEERFGVEYGDTVCGRRVKLSDLEPEPTGPETMDRCAVCRRHAREHGADGRE